MRAFHSLIQYQSNAIFSSPSNLFLLLPTTAMSVISSDPEDRISKALQAYHDRDKPKIAPLAREFGVSYSQLFGRVHGRTSRSARPGPNKALDKSQEQALMDWVALLDDANASLTAQEVEATANEILSRSGTDDALAKTWHIASSHASPTTSSMSFKSQRKRSKWMRRDYRQ